MKLTESYKNRMNFLAGVPDKKINTTLKLNETIDERTWKKVEFLISYLGPAEALEAFVRAIDDGIINQAINNIIREHNLKSQYDAEVGGEINPESEDVRNIFTDDGIDSGMGNFSLNEKKENWIKDVKKDIEKRGTEGVCSGDKFGSDSCPPGSKRYNLAKTFKKMHEESVNEGDLSVFDYHRKQIAIKTLKMSDVAAAVMGGMTKEEARTFLSSIGYTPEKINSIESGK